MAQKVKTIMQAGSRIIRDNQKAIRRQLDKRGIPMKVIAMDSGIKPATLATYFPQDQYAEPAQISGGAIYDLFGVLPDDLMSLLMPQGFAVVRVPDGIDLDAVASECHTFLSQKTAAHHPESEDGAAISDNERAELEGTVTQMRGRA